MLRSMRPFVTLVAFLAFISAALADNWPQWRGPHGTGVCDATNLPMHWSTNENVHWRVALPDRGNSTPIVWGNRVFVTQAIDKNQSSKHTHRRTLICFDRATGKQLWQSGIDVTNREPTHGTNPYCSASPVTDGESVIVSYGTPGLYAYDFEGKELWHRDLGEQRHIWGNAASPIIYKDLCILNFGPGERQFVIGVNKKTGETVWQHDEPGGDSGEEKKGATTKPAWVGSWTTPIIIQSGGGDELIMSFPTRVAGLDPQTGKEHWTCSGLNPLVYTSPLYANGIVVAMGGYGGSSLGVKTGGHGDVTQTHRLWQVPKNKQRIGSGVIRGDYIYILDDPGIAECIDLKTGKVVWEERLKGKAAKGDNWSSAMLSGDKWYTINQAGDAFVVRASPKFELLASSSLGETSMSSIVPSNGELFIRTYKALWCISEKR